MIVYADWMGRSPQEVEDQVTYPLSANLQGLAGVKAVRAASMFGFSLITVVFDDKINNYFARSRVLERLNYLGDILPAGVEPKLGPDATGLGWVYDYYLDVDSGKIPEQGAMIWGNCAPPRTGLCATSSIPFRALRKSPASAGRRGNIKSKFRR